MPVSALLVDSDIKVRKFANFHVLKTIIRAIYISSTTTVLVISWKPTLPLYPSPPYTTKLLGHPLNFIMNLFIVDIDTFIILIIIAMLQQLALVNYTVQFL